MLQKQNHYSYQHQQERYVVHKMEYKKAEMSWLMVAIILSLIFLLSVVMISNGIFQKVFTGFGIGEEEVDIRTACIAEIGSSEDKNGDGFVDGVVSYKGKQVDCSKASERIIGR